MIVFAPTPIPVVTQDGKEGWILYVNDGGMYENDIFCIVLCEGGMVRHFTSSQFTIFKNATFDIKKKENE